MKKLINFAIATVIAIIVLYLISLVVAAIVIVAIVLIKWVIRLLTPFKEFTEWEFHRDTTPIFSMSNGVKMYQNQSHWTRINNLTQEIETKIVVDPIKRPITEPKTLTDAWNLRFV